MQRLRTGHARTHRAAVHRQRVALLPVGQYGVLPVLAIDRTPARLADDAPFGFKRHAFALRTDGGRVLDALRGERFYHAPHNHVVDELLVLVKSQRTVRGHQQRMVVGHFRCVHAAAVQFAHICNLLRKGRMTCQTVEQRRHFVKHVLRDVAARRSRIGDELRLIELLHEVERLFRREAVLRVRLLLKCS